MLQRHPPIPIHRRPPLSFPAPGNPSSAVSLDLPFQTFHINVIIEYVLIRVWLLLLGTFFLRLIGMVACISPSFLTSFVLCPWYSASAWHTVDAQGGAEESQGNQVPFQNESSCPPKELQGAPKLPWTRYWSSAVDFWTHSWRMWNASGRGWYWVGPCGRRVASDMILWWQAICRTVRNWKPHFLARLLKEFPFA